MNDAALQSLFLGRKGLVLVSDGEYAVAPVIDGVRAGETGTYPAGWGALSATSSESLVGLTLSQAETDWLKWDDLDDLCTLRQYISLNIQQVSMTREVFARTFGAGEWDAALGAYRAEGRISSAYKSMLVLFMGAKEIMAVYFSRVKIFPGENLLTPSLDYFMTLPLAGFVQEPTTGAGKYVIYPPRERR
ncbi:hypothetical protein [Rothia sp. (in: high G+C Gram-positive bacteria)]|uniref:hypothetical protein n=1 Tax=Rothia sp. (in: high G+C Gram-positive bacteria) TaxID=1885016 RepID=UPI000EC46C11|nr:hypothetical protein [Rothia sp. (in: high G+C Gram-positive bacteria)]